MNMPAVAAVQADVAALPALVQRAASALSGAVSAAEVLEARELAGLAFDAARRAARLERAKAAHDSLVSAAIRAQGDALLIESQAKIRLADEYDAAQERGEVAGARDGSSGRSNGERPATAADIGLTRKQVHEARQLRDTERQQPGIFRQIVHDRVERGQEPNRAALRQAVVEAAQGGLRAGLAPGRRNPLHLPDAAYDRVASIAGTCRTLIEKTEDLSLAEILSGCANTQMRARTLSDLHECRDRLSELLEEDHVAEAQG